VVWETIKGIAQANDVVGGITGSGTPWSTREGGGVVVELISGQVGFSVVGLVRAGGSEIGTPGPISQVKGTLVCGPGSASPKVIDTPLVPLNAQGNAQFTGSFSSSTAACNPMDVAFLVRNMDRQRLYQGVLTNRLPQVEAKASSRLSSMLNWRY
jgi:hypothetical protein